MFHKILVANRGEIALRVMRTCREMGIRTVAVHSQADGDSHHVRFADEAVCIGPAPSKDSYLSVPAIISAAEITDAEAIHPGYGFLAENPHFAEVCDSCKIVFIGPDASVMRTMGNKIQARELMKSHGVPVLPGTEKPVTSQDEATARAREIRYPVIVKAAAGGGGRGMRVAHTDGALRNAFHTTRAEADSAFGNSEVYLEKFLEDPRHVEVQIMGDGQGRVLHLGERDCTIQRRHQKLVEEAPCPSLSPELRKKMVDAAIKGAEAAGYRGAGTVEFLLDEGEQAFYFMEINARIQVEHPVTEEVMGMDIVREQIRIAAGEPLPWKQSLVARGHAFECRINAEDPTKGFRPTPGKIQRLQIPGGPGVRIDTHIYQGYTVPHHYDSLLAKLITHGATRDEALSRMRRALDEFEIEGVPTTLPFHRRLFADKRFQESRYGTGFVDTLTKEFGWD